MEKIMKEICMYKDSFPSSWDSGSLKYKYLKMQDGIYKILILSPVSM